MILKKCSLYFKQLFYKVLPFLMTTLGQGLIRLILLTCRWEVKGIERFKELASKEKCILMLWHNRLAIAAPLLYKFAPHFIYAAVVSNSRDGKLLSAIIHSYKTGRTIPVAHNARYQALQTLVRYIKEKQEVVIITPDGPRGPCYQLKPGVAVAALETGAYVIPLTWSANRYWELHTWDRLKLPKPFAKIEVLFKEPVQFQQNHSIDLKEAQAILQQSLRDAL